MKYIWIRVIVALWLSFMIATVGPALFGDMLTWTGPVTCPGGTVTVQSDTYYPRPGETDTTRTPLCNSADGSTTEIPTLPAMGVIWIGSFVPALLIIVFLPADWFNWNREYTGTTVGESQTIDAPAPEHETLARLNELKQAHDAGLITQEEYDSKRKEIVKGM